MAEWFDWWDIREGELMAKLVADLNAITNTPFTKPWVVGQNCWEGEAVPAVNTWHLVMGGGNDEKSNFKPRAVAGQTITEIRMDVDLGGWFTERKAAMQFAMMVLSLVPYQAAQLPGFQWVRQRQGGTPAVEKELVKLGPQAEDRTLNVMGLGLEAVFNTPTPTP